MPRRRLTKLARVRIFDAARGLCHLCGLKIHAERGEKWDIDHVTPLWLGGPDTESNLRPAHKSCHRTKSADENPDRAKTDRMRASHLGIAGPGRGTRPMPGGKRSQSSKTMSGKVVLRRSQIEKHRDAMAARQIGERP